MCETSFLERCAELCDSGLSFIGLEKASDVVVYFFAQKGESLQLEQVIEEGTIHSISSLFPLADFPERQLYRDFGIKALGNTNLVLEEEN